jgi:hypothetical protein
MMIVSLCMSQFHAYRTWLDDDAHAGMEDYFSADIVELEQSHQMWTFLRSRYEPTGQSSIVLGARSSVAHSAAPILPVSPRVAPSAARGVSTGLHYDHCDQDGHMEAFFYRNKKAQARHSS